MPEYPTIFGRWTASLSVDTDPVAVPAGELGLDWEGEVAAYLGDEFAGGGADAARAAVLGYSTFNDLTARRAQKLTSQWTLGKNVDRSGPLGPLITADEVGDLREGLRIRTRVNGAVMQDASTADMIFDVGQLVSFLGGVFTLAPGDVIATGTPEGVGYTRKPPRLLGGGDVVEVEVDRLGVLRTPVVAARG
ncbi:MULTISPECIES: fumarylacetoacetate hydrolase family protein [unclassified Nocardia]|uniref:fumarylacetoacetate hydrolase family protein n=1 Tax=unclassified Nocardia TaxID=2637762 RepID=UPI0033B99573